MKKFVPLLILAAVLFALLGCPSEPKQPKTKTFKVSYVSEYGPAPEQKTVKENYALTQADLAPLSSEAATNAHKVFQGWFIDSSIPANPGDKITKNTTLVARWEPQRLTVTYVTPYGAAPDSITLDYGTQLSVTQLPVLQDDSHSFTGWFADGIEIKADFAVTKNLTLTAQWDKTKRTVTLIDEKHPDTDPVSVLHGETATLPAPADVTGYDFKGWFAGETEFTSTTPVSADITLTAKWEIQRFTVTYITTTGTAPAPITLDYGTQLTVAQLPTLSAPDGQHIQHNGWTSDNGRTICKVGDVIIADTTLVAQWGPEQLKLTVQSSVEGFPASVDVDYGSKIKDVISSEAFNPTLQYYELLGWKIDNAYYPLTYEGEDSISTTKTLVPQFKIKENAFKSSAITEFTVPEGVREIGAYAFAGSKIASITIPDSVTSIGNYAFQDCANLTSITIPQSVSYISTGTFENCQSLSSVYAPVSSIGSYAFRGCTSLTSTAFRSDTMFSGSAIFEGCTSLTSAFIPDSYAILPESIFKGCTNLASVTIFNKVLADIRKSAFEDCTSLTSITFYGTEEKWHSISKGTDWNKNVPESCVITFKG